MKYNLFFLSCLLCISCHSQIEQKNTAQSDTINDQPTKTLTLKNVVYEDSEFKTIHVFVALCDNLNQGILPVPEKIGNGQDPNSNLYWGCGYGVRTFFKNSADWQLISRTKLDTMVLERLVFKHKTQKYYLVADAYDGRYIKKCIENFLFSASGQVKDTFCTKNQTIGINGNSSLVAYVGHDGLMEFPLTDSFKNFDGKKRDAMIFACSSRANFGDYLRATLAQPLVWTNTLMCPEAYTLHDAIEGYLQKESPSAIRMRAVQAYAKYQKITESQAAEILVTGW